MNIREDKIQNSVENIFEAQQTYASSYKKSDYKERIRNLNKIFDFLSNKENEDKICEALYNDFKKPRAESISSEIGVVKTAIKFIKRNLRNWMDKEYVPTPLMLMGASSYIKYEPKGVCLIIGPWNYPFQLCLSPLIYALAAGNTAIIKPSEFPSHVSKLVNDMIQELFDPKLVTVKEGGIPVAQELLSLPFDHIYFTGSPAVGKIVMEAAAKNLSSVTLELGGKSPCIIDESANIKQAARRTCWAKFLNGGQTCIAPDYVLVHESKKAEFLEEFKKNVERMYNPEQKGIQNSPDFCRIINKKNFKRASELIENAVQNGARIYHGGKVDEEDLYISPTLITDVTDEMDIMREEIFAPILPVISYQNKEDATDLIRNKPKPLALYIHAKKKRNIDYFLNETTAGGTMINDFHAYYANPNLPFGGVNNSGFGKTHGHYGFKEFSNARAVMHQKYGQTDLLHPPFSKRTFQLLKWMTRMG